MAAKLLDKVGQVYGKLTVIRRSTKTDGKQGWLCQCECGNTKILDGKFLNINKTKLLSCGCSINWANEHNRLKLEDQRFGKLIVKKYDHVLKKYHCLCDCGNKTIVSSKKLRKGHTVSCGCYRKQVAGNNSFRYTDSSFHDTVTSLGFYSPDDYKGSQKNHIFYCTKNHLFHRRYCHLLVNPTCPICKELSKPRQYNGQYSYEFFENNVDIANSLGYLYFVKLTSKNECFYKIGITRISVKERLRKLSYIYDIKVLGIATGTVRYIYTMEQKFLQVYKEFRYVPKTDFAGITECFKF